MIEDLNGAPEGAVVVLHACAHNPTGKNYTAYKITKDIDNQWILL